MKLLPILLWYVIINNFTCFLICFHKQSLLTFHSCLCSDDVFGSWKSQEGDADDKKK